MRQQARRLGLPRSLLLVQRQSAAAKALGRLLKDYYRDVLVAESPEVAERLLQGQQTNPTDVVCGENFGPGCPLGHDLVASWRHRYPAIERVVLATGAEHIPTAMMGVDGVYRKPAPLSLLLTLLGIEGAGVSVPRSSEQQPPTSPLEQAMKTTSPQAHTVHALKERLSQGAKNDSQSSQLKSARGFATA